MNHQLLKSIIKSILLTEAPIDIWLNGKAKKERPPVSREDVESFFNDFEVFKSYFVLPDATQYTLSELKFSVAAAKFLKENSIKAEKAKPIISWFLGQIRRVKDISWQFIKEDYVPLLKSYVNNISLLKPISEYSEISALHKDIDSKQIGVYKPATESEKDIFFQSNGWSVGMPQTTEASCDLGAGTTWCTARRGEGEQNLFLSYVGRGDRDIILFYVMKDGADHKTDRWSMLSVGFENGEPAFNQGAGNISVNAANENLTEDKFNQLLGKDVAELFLRKMSEKAESTSGKHPAKKELEDIALNVNKFKQKLASFRNEEYRSDFIENILNMDNVSPAIFHVLSSDMFIDKNEDLVRLVAKNKNTPTEILNKISESSHDIFITRAICRNQNTPEKTLMKFAASADKDLRYTVSLNLNVTPAILDILSRDTSDRVRTSVASNRKITPAIIDTLSKDEVPIVVITLSKNARVPAEKLIDLAKNKNEFVADAIAENPNSPPEALRIIAGSASYLTKEKVAKNPTTPPDALAILGKDYFNTNAIFMLQQVALNPKTPIETLIGLAKNTQSEVKKFIFYNDSLTKEVLEILAADDDYIISDKAIKKLERMNAGSLTESIKLYRILY